MAYPFKLIAQMREERDALLTERDQLRAELEAIRGQQPVAWASPDVAGGVRWSPGALQQLSDGSSLHALPPQQPDAVSVPMELLERLALPKPDGRGWTTYNTALAFEAAKELRALLCAKEDADGPAQA